MAKKNNSSLWIEEGYKLYAEEGLEGIQIERLARITNLNKSGFYHYFGDLDGYCIALIGLHEKVARNFLDELQEIKTIDPDFFHLLVQYKVPVMFQMQINRNRKHELFFKVAEQIEKTEDAILQPLWIDYLGVKDKPDLAMRYFGIVRDMFYTRITFKNFDYPFLENLVTEAKVVMQQLAEGNLAYVSDRPLS